MDILSWNIYMNMNIEHATEIFDETTKWISLAYSPMSKHKMFNFIYLFIDLFIIT